MWRFWRRGRLCIFAGEREKGSADSVAPAFEKYTSTFDNGMWGRGNAPTCVKLTIYFFSELTKLVNWKENMQWSQWKILVACPGRWPRHVLLPLFVLQMCYGCAVRSLQFNCCCAIVAVHGVQFYIPLCNILEKSRYTHNCNLRSASLEGLNMVRPEVEFTRLFINNQWVEAVSGRWSNEFTDFRPGFC